MVKPRFRPFKFHRMLCNKLDQVEQGKIKRLIITVPPRHGKSLVASVGFPGYYLGKHPGNKIITISYGADQATEFGRDVRNIVADPVYQDIYPGIMLRKDSKAANRWHTNFGGMYIAAGIGGPVTGKGGNVIIIDDPHKNRKEADSKTKSDEVWSFYQSTLYSRQEPNLDLEYQTAIVVIMQRWNEFDLVGRLLEAAKQEGGDQWEVVNMPALADAEGKPTDDWEHGRPLVPEMFPKPALKKLKVTMGTRNWESQCQQQPTGDTGVIVQRQWFRYWSHTPTAIGDAVLLPKRFDEIIQSWDLAFKAAEENSRVSATVWGRLGADVYLLDEICENLSFVDTLRAFTGMAQKHPDAKRKLVEDKANGPALESILKKKVYGIIMVEPEGDKKARMWAVTPMIESGNVYLPSSIMPGYAWVNDFVEEVVGFPNAKKNDRADSTSQALKYFEKYTDNIFQQLSKL